MRTKCIQSIFVIFLFLANSTSFAKHTNKVIIKTSGTASWYSYQAGNRSHLTASGKLFNPNEKSAAHRQLPFGTKVDVTNLRTEKTVRVVINDRGPYVKGRIIDLSQSAAKAIGMKGIDKVKLKIVS